MWFFRDFFMSSGAENCASDYVKIKRTLKFLILFPLMFPFNLQIKEPPWNIHKSRRGWKMSLRSKKNHQPASASDENNERMNKFEILILNYLNLFFTAVCFEVSLDESEFCSEKWKNTCSSRCWNFFFRFLYDDSTFM